MHIFTKSGDNWVEYYAVESPLADGSDGYGFDVSVDGTTLLVSAPFDSRSNPDGSAYFITK